MSTTPHEAFDEAFDSRDGAPSTGLVLQDTYTLGTRLGQGGMGEVYEASHVRLPGKFAVKILRPDLLANKDAYARFCREAEIMSELRHPHIIQIFDFNTSTSGLPYFVMEYLDGIDLETRMMASGALPLSDIIHIIEGVTSALGAAHTMGVVHRDLKPANIFLIRGEGGDEDFVKVIDFGISKTMHAGPQLSNVTEVMGTPAFMSPEQALGLTSKIDPRTDQFALAGITFLMLTGREPFLGDEPTAVLYQVVHETPPALAGFLPWETTGIQAVLDRAFAKNPEDRFASIGDFAASFISAAHAAQAASAAVGAPAPLPPAAAPAPVAPATVPELPASEAVTPPLRLMSLPRPPSQVPAPPSLAEVLQMRRPKSEDAATPVQLPVASVAPPEPSVASDHQGADDQHDEDETLPRDLDRVPRGPQRAFVLAAGVLALGAVIVHKGWYEGFPQRAVKAEHALVSQAERLWREHRPAVATSSPSSDSAPSQRLAPIPPQGAVAAH